VAHRHRVVASRSELFLSPSPAVRAAAPLRDARADDADAEADPERCGCAFFTHVTSFARGGELARGGMAAVGSRRRRHDKLFSSEPSRARAREGKDARARRCTP